MIFYIQLFTLLVAIVNLWLGIFILIKSHRDKLKIMFGCFTLITGIWVLLNFLLRIFVDYYLQRLTFSLGALLPVFIIIWLFYFYNPHKKIKKIATIILGILSAIFFILPFIGDLIVEGSLPVDNPFVGFQKGILFPVFSFYVSAIVVLPLIICFFIWKQSHGLKREQIKYIFFGFILYGLGSLFFSMILPLFGVNNYSSLDCIFSIFFVCFTTYSITRYRLMDLKLIISRSIIFFLLTLIIAGVFVLSFTFSALFFAGTIGANPYLVWLFTSIVIVVGLEPLKNLLAELTDKIFFERKINYDEVLKQLTEILSKELVVKKIVDRLEKNLSRCLKVQQTKIFVSEKDFAAHSYLLNHFNRENEILVFDEIEKKADENILIHKKYQKIIGKLKKIKAAVAVPVYRNKKITAILVLGFKNNGEMFNNNDLQMLEMLSPQLSAALFKASLYQETQQFNIKLQKEIEKATDEFKTANKELAKANAHLQNLDDAKSEFMSITSHQLRTPLSGIMGYLSMILEGDYGKINKKQLPVYKDIFQASLRLIRMVNLFLNISRIEAGHFAFNFNSEDLYSVAQEIVYELLPTAQKKGLSLILRKKEENFPRAEVDIDKIKDVILNLTDNAIKYTEKGEIIISLKRINNKVLIAITDNGLGIDPIEADKLFNKFVRGDGMVKVNPDGSGLGLFIAKKIVEGHHGRIWVESRGLNKGSTFFIELPIKQNI